MESILSLISSKCFGYSSGSKLLSSNFENLFSYRLLSCFSTVAYLATWVPFILFSSGMDSSDNGILTPADAIPLRHAAILLVKDVFPAYKMAESLFLLSIFLPSNKPTKKLADRLFDAPFHPYFASSLLFEKLSTISPFKFGFINWQ